MTQDYIIRGTEVKYKVDLTASGFDMDSCDFFFTIYCGGKSLTVLKPELVTDGEDWYLCFDTSGFDPGDDGGDPDTSTYCICFMTMCL